MTEDENQNSAIKAPRVVAATRFRDGVRVADFEIHGSTKHGSTAMIAIMPPDKLEAGDTIVATAWVLGVRNLNVVGEHKRPMKIPGTWYEVQLVKQKK